MFRNARANTFWVREIRPRLHSGAEQPQGKESKLFRSGRQKVGGHHGRVYIILRPKAWSDSKKGGKTMKKKKRDKDDEVKRREKSQEDEQVRGSWNEEKVYERKGTKDEEIKQEIDETKENGWKQKGGEKNMKN